MKETKSVAASALQIIIYVCFYYFFPQCANQCRAVPALTNIRRAKDSQWVINISTHRKSKYSLWAYFKSLSFKLVYVRLLWCWGKKRIFCKYQKLKQISQTGLKKKKIYSWVFNPYSPTPSPQWERVWGDLKCPLCSLYKYTRSV